MLSTKLAWVADNYRYGDQNTRFYGNNEDYLELDLPSRKDLVIGNGDLMLGLRPAKSYEGVPTTVGLCSVIGEKASKHKHSSSGFRGKRPLSAPAQPPAQPLTSASKCTSRRPSSALAYLRSRGHKNAGKPRGVRSRPQSAPVVEATSISRGGDYGSRRFGTGGTVSRAASAQARAPVFVVHSAPDNTFPDRHARCHNHTHIHSYLFRNRPTSACGRHGAGCTDIIDTRYDAAEKQAITTAERQACYKDAMRPRTAPSKRTNLTYLPRSSFITRGNVPHFCNFAAQKDLSERHPDLSAPEDSEYPTYPVSTVPSEGQLSLQELTSDDEDIDKTVLSRDPDEYVRTQDAPSDLHDDSLEEGPDLDPTPAPSECHIPSTDKDTDFPGKTALSKTAAPKPIIATVPEPEKEETVFEDIKREPSPKPEPKQNTADNAPPVSTPASTKAFTRPCARNRNQSIQPGGGKQLVVELPKPSSSEETSSQRLSPPLEKPKTPDIVRKSPQPARPVSPPPLPRPEIPKPRPPNTTVNKKVVQRRFMQFSMDESRNQTNDGEGDGSERKTRDAFAFDANASETTEKKPMNKGQPWLLGRLALSKQASRFELPIDMRKLESMTAQDYLRQYCIISSRRYTLYQKIFLKHKDKVGALLPKDLARALKDVLINTIDREELQVMFDLAEVKDNSKVDFKLFCGIAAMAERILYPKFLTEDTQDANDHKKETIESADFCALKWKLHGVDVNPSVRRILEAL